MHQQPQMCTPQLLTGRRSPRPPSRAGEEPHSGIVASVSSGNPALVTCIDDERLEFQVRLQWEMHSCRR